MRFDLNEKISVFSTVNGFYIRDGFVFDSAGKLKHNIYDVIVIRNPEDATAGRIIPHTSRSFEEYIALINEEKIERAYIYADDLSFISRCPTLKDFYICPPNTACDGYDYSPLYNIPEIRELSCQTVYGSKEEKSTSIDYSNISGLVDLGVCGKGHLNYSSVETLQNLFLSNIKNRDNLRQISKSDKLKSLSIMQCGFKSLSGIEQYQQLQSLSLDYNRSLDDITNLNKIAYSLRALSIESCPKITDFSCLETLTNLEHLDLNGSNSLPDLKFLRTMKKLKTFTFSMNVLDNDLTPALDVPYASCSKAKKTYNLKDKDLPKQRPTVPFEII